MFESHITLLRPFLEDSFARDIFNRLINHEHIKFYDQLTNEKGEIVKIHRKMAYVSDRPILYHYANLKLDGQTWVDELVTLRDILKNALDLEFNSVLLNLYNDGKDEIRWHSDKEKQLGANPIIACLNLGSTRKFWFLEKSTGVKTSYPVQNGDLLVMGPHCQEEYLHAILKEKDVTEPRLSLTFRKVLDDTD